MKFNKNDLIGNRYGKLTVLDYAGRDKRGCHQYRCRCDCGNTDLIVRRDALRSGNTKSCGCMRHEMIDVNDLIENRYGRIEVVRYNGWRRIGNTPDHYYLCHCDCGNDVEISRKTLLSGRINKCGKCGKILKEDDHYKYICYSGEEWIFDAVDLDLVESYQWHVCDGRYPTTYYNKTQKAFHQLAMGTEEGVYVDHINGNTLDNRRCNLRLATALDNARNKVILPYNTTGYKGVSSYHKQRKTRPFRAQISIKRKRIHLGYFDTPEEAASAYDEAARFYFGEFACVNFPREGEQGCLRNQ